MRFELRRRPFQGRVGHGLEPPQRMVPEDPFLQVRDGRQAALGVGTTAYQGCPRCQGGLSLSPRFVSSLPRSEGPSVCGLNPIMIANVGADLCHVPGSIRSRPCTGLWRNGSFAGRNWDRQMQCCAVACGVAHAAVGRDGGEPAGSGPYRPDHGCAGPATAPRGYMLDLSKGDGWSHDHPVYRGHTK